jgi:hypothetical protein
MNAPAAKQQEPTFFTGTSFAVGEIELGLRVLAAKTRDLKRGNETGSAVDQKLAAEAISKLAGQIAVLADTLVRVSCAHLNRRPRP